MKRKDRLLFQRPLALLLWAMLFACSGANVFAQYQLDQSVLPGGGGTSTSASPSYSIDGTIGQALAGSSSGAGYTASGGFVPGVYPPSGGGTIVGQVTMASNGMALSSVSLSLFGPVNRSVKTDGSGNYSFTDLPPGNYTITPSRFAFAFTPSGMPQSVAANTTYTANFVGTSTGVNPQIAGGPVLISELRLSGITSNDEFIELYNNTNSPVDISGFRVDTLSGFAITIPPSTAIPAHGHYLIANQIGYSLSATVPADLTYNFDIPEDTGVALFDSSGLITDAVGFGASGIPYREGTALTPDLALANQSYFRNEIANDPKDTGDNAADFVHARTDAVGAPLGAPGPQNLASPIQRNYALIAGLVDSTVGVTVQPNRVRNSAPYVDTLSGTGTYPLGTLSVRRTYVNNTGAPITRLRFRIVDITAASTDTGVADIRAISSGTVSVTTNDTSRCAPNPAPCVVPLRGTTLELSPIQPGGGGLNSTLLSSDITLATPLANGKSINLQYLLGVLKTGTFRFYVNIEVLP
jgi:hypothetical protein